MTDDIVTRLRTVDEFSDAIGIMNAAADEIERLRAEVACLGGFLHPIGATTHPPCSPTNRHTVVCKCDGRRVLPWHPGLSFRTGANSTFPCDCEACEGEARRD